MLRPPVCTFPTLVSLASVGTPSKPMEPEKSRPSQSCPRSSCKSKKSGQNSRQKKKEDQRAAAAAVEQTVRTAKNLPNFLYLATKNRRFKGTPSVKKPVSLRQDASQEEKPRMFVVYECPGSVLPSKNPELSAEIFNLTKANMQQLYDEVKFMEHGWRDEVKKRELAHQDSRLLVVLTDEEDAREDTREGRASDTADTSAHEGDPTPLTFFFASGCPPRKCHRSRVPSAIFCSHPSSDIHG